ESTPVALHTKFQKLSVSVTAMTTGNPIDVYLYQDTAASGDKFYADAFSLVASSSSTCTPTTCAAQGKNCGSISDGCGGNLSCGSCTSPQTCGGGGTANVCGSAGSTSSFITRSGSQLRLNGSQFRFGGMNMQWLGWNSSKNWPSGGYTSHAEADAIFSSV